MHFGKITKKLSSHSKVSVTLISLLRGGETNMVATYLTQQLFIFA